MSSRPVPLAVLSLVALLAVGCGDEGAAAPPTGADGTAAGDGTSGVPEPAPSPSAGAAPRTPRVPPGLAAAQDAFATESPLGPAGKARHRSPESGFDLAFAWEQCVILAQSFDG